MTLKGKVALVTGSSEGLGRAILEKFASQGADVVINYHSDAAGAEAVEKAVRAEGVRALSVQADASAPDGIKSLFDAAMNEFGKIDIVVANAGIEIVNINVADFTDDDYERLIRINTKGSFYVLREAARRISDNGRIITISSNTTTVPQVGVGAYGGSKIATNYLVRVLALELGPRGITVNTVIPGPIDGAGIFTDPKVNVEYRQSLIATIPLGRMGTVQDVAGVTGFLASDDAGLITGQQLVADGGMH
ncbi:SDR family oxidoreductase [Actinoplanes sp. TBRC 11911]|uniref:SDR family NAD(P)-dependent oxidoreductase n=1 Tax=Actinoplanes sp. TBRC 11911 TaxID=2729386 RepID=UPI00145CFE7E|nr:SDR family oxidoreductase [Actinoplanes sp. TBRC 11911]NMO55298.1 SDR family oxidoreductase [Actinoplanes sp. TBRC 11911]